MGYFRPNNMAPVFPTHTMPMHTGPNMMPNVMPAYTMPNAMPNVMPAAYTPPVAPKPIHHNIHLHAIQQTAVVYPKPVHHVKPVAVAPYNNVGSILVLFILLIIITRGFFHHKC